MAQWAKVKFFWDTMLGSAGSNLTATSTASGDYSVNYLYDMLEVNMWKAANATAPVYITYDAGTGNTKTADYLAILGHNLKTIGASIALQYSSDNAVWNDAVAAFAPSADTVILKEFASPGAFRYWRLAITGALASAPYMTICVWGNKTELDYATASFDPYRQEVRANINLSQGGYVAGVHTHYVERRLELKFSDADSSLYGKALSWWEGSGRYLKNIFIAWENANNQGDVFFMYPDPVFNNPFANGGAYRDINLSFRGRRE